MLPLASKVSVHICLVSQPWTYGKEQAPSHLHPWCLVQIVTHSKNYVSVFWISDETQFWIGKGKTQLCSVSEEKRGPGSLGTRPQVKTRTMCSPQSKSNLCLRPCFLFLGPPSSVSHRRCLLQWAGPRECQECLCWERRDSCLTCGLSGPCFF